MPWDGEGEGLRTTQQFSATKVEKYELKFVKLCRFSRFLVNTVHACRKNIDCGKVLVPSSGSQVRKQKKTLNSVTTGH